MEEVSDVTSDIEMEIAAGRQDDEGGETMESDDDVQGQQNQYN